MLFNQNDGQSHAMQTWIFLLCCCIFLGGVIVLYVVAVNEYS